MSGKPPDYVEVNERLLEWREKYPDGSLQSDIVPSPFEGFICVKARAYRTPDDERPGEGLAWEPVPGKTNFTRDSELMNAETSAWGRALIAVGAADAKRGIASANEVRNRQSAERSKPAAQPKPRDDREHAHVMGELAALLPSLPDDKRQAAANHAAKGVKEARVALARAKQIIASQPAETSAPEQAPFEPVTDEVLGDLVYELGQLSKAARDKETARLLGEASVASLEELPDRDARKAQERLTKKRAEREAKEAAA